MLLTWSANQGEVNCIRVCAAGGTLTVIFSAGSLALSTPFEQMGIWLSTKRLGVSCQQVLLPGAEAL